PCSPPPRPPHPYPLSLHDALPIFGLLLLIPARRVYHKILDAAGHGELLILAGLALALGGSSLFEAVKLKGDLGALICGALFASQDRKSTRLNSSHVKISYAVFCLK